MYLYSYQAYTGLFMSTYLDLTWRIRYEGADRKILNALDESDAVRMIIVRLAAQRALAIQRGNEQMQKTLTKKINKKYGDWLDAMRITHRLVKIANLWGDPTLRSHDRSH